MFPHAYPGVLEEGACSFRRNLCTEKLFFQILSKYVIICLGLNVRSCPLIGHVSCIEFFYAQMHV